MPANSVIKLTCWNCGESIDDIPLPISRHANCQKCFEVLHCCRLCEFYAPGRPGDCDQEPAEPPSNKESANFCAYFKPKPNAFSSSNQNQNDATKSKLDALFETDPNSDKDDASPTPSNDKPNPLDDLFN